MSFVRSIHWKHNCWGFSAPLPREFLPVFFVSYLKWDQFSTELMMTLRREMLLYEVMRGLPNAYLDCTNAQRVVQSGSLPVAYRWCSCLEAGAVGAWPCPSPGAHPRWHQCLCLRGGASVSSCAAELTLSPPCLGSQSSWKATSSCFTTHAYCALRPFKARADRKARKVRGLLVFGRSEHQLTDMLEHGSSRLLNGSPDFTVVKVMNVGDGKRSIHLLSWKV